MEQLTDSETRELRRLLAKAEASESAGKVSKTGVKSSGSMSDASKRRLVGEESKPSVDLPKVPSEKEFEFVTYVEDEVEPHRIYANQDKCVDLPKDCADAVQWGATKIVMKKFEKENLSYEGLVQRALSGDKETDRYCQLILNKYKDSDGKTQAPDLSKFLHRIQYADRSEAGFVRSFVK